MQAGDRGDSGAKLRRAAGALALALVLVAGCGSVGAPGGEAPLDIIATPLVAEAQPGDVVPIEATATRGGRPERGVLVTFNVYLPQGGVRWLIGPPTDAEGRTSVRYRFVQDGYYYVEVTAQQTGEIVTTNTLFRVRRSPEG